jgi:hypothetical protein
MFSLGGAFMLFSAPCELCARSMVRTRRPGAHPASTYGYRRTAQGPPACGAARVPAADGGNASFGRVRDDRPVGRLPRRTCCECGCRWPTDVLRICEDHSPSAIDQGPSSLFLLRTARRTTRFVCGRHEARSSETADSYDSNRSRTCLRCWHARSAHTGRGETKRRARHERAPSASPSGRERAGGGPARAGPRGRRRRHCAQRRPSPRRRPPGAG